MERAILRLLGVDGIGPNGVPLANLFVERLGNERLAEGAASALARLVAHTGRTADDVASGIGDGSLEMAVADAVSGEAARHALARPVARTLVRIDTQREIRDRLQGAFAAGAPYPMDRVPAIHVVAGCGVISDDRMAASEATERGERAIAVRRPPGEKLLDFVSYGATAVVSDGTPVTQENLRVLREALDAVATGVGRYVLLACDASGLCLPEIAAIGVLERLDVLLGDPVDGLFASAVDRTRTHVDLRFARRLCARGGTIVAEAFVPRNDPSGVRGGLGGDGVFACAESYWNPFAAA